MSGNLFSLASFTDWIGKVVLEPTQSRKRAKREYIGCGTYLEPKEGQNFKDDTFMMPTRMCVLVVWEPGTNR